MTRNYFENWRGQSLNDLTVGQQLNAPLMLQNTLSFVTDFYLVGHKLQHGFCYDSFYSPRSWSRISCQDSLRSFISDTHLVYLGTYVRVAWDSESGCKLLKTIINSITYSLQCICYLTTEQRPLKNLRNIKLLCLCASTWLLVPYSLLFLSVMV